MARSLNHQPITLDPLNLVIGVPGFRIREIDGVDFTTSTADAVASPLVVGDSLGSLQSGSFTADASFKVHESGYPKREDARILEQNEVVFTVVTEELGLQKVKDVIDDILGQLAGVAAKTYASEMRAEKYAGGGISYYSGNSQVKPQFSLSSQNDWIGLELQFESLLASSYTNKDLAYRANFAGSARDVDNQAVTTNPSNLGIGFAQVRMGPITPRASAGGNGTITAPRFFTGLNSSSVAAGMTANAGTNYTGTLDGAFVVKITDTKWQRRGTGSGGTFDVSTGTGDNTLVFNVDVGTIYTVTFTDDAALSINDVVTEINAAGPGTPASKTSDNKILLESATGVAGTVEITTANTSLGFAVDGGVLTASEMQWVDEGGTITTGVTVTGALQTLSLGVDVTFVSASAHSIDDAWAVGVTTTSARASTPSSTLINSPYPYLSNSDSIGAVQAVTLGIEATIKDHFSGYPQKKDAFILESSSTTLDISAEEFDYAAGPLSAGLATTLSDMVFDSSINGNRYHAPFEMVIELLDGGVVTYWLPNGEIVGNVDISPSDDWAAVPFQVASQFMDVSVFDSGALAPRQIYQYDEDLA